MLWSVLFGVLVFEGTWDPSTTRPSPALGPRSVVALQLEALRSDPDPVGTLVRFASPRFLTRAGGREGIRRAVHEDWAILAQQSRALIEPTLGPPSRRATLLVIALDPAGPPVGFVFEMRRDETDCWRIDDLRRLRPARRMPTPQTMKIAI
ncbi:MAG: hypothetical protein AAFU79_26070 [Myxococcota bacterium]